MKTRFVAAATLAALLALPVAALAAPVSFSFTASGFVHPEDAVVGDRITLTVVDVDPALVGQTCTFTGTTVNGESVHVNNHAVIATDGNDSDVEGTEDGVNGVHVVDRTLELGPTITIYYYIGRRAVDERPVGVSVDMEFTVTCQDTTTTTVPPPASSSTTTTVPNMTTTTGGTTSTTTPAPPSTAGTPPSTTIPPVEPPTDDTLPLTGSDGLVGWRVAAVALIVLGAAGVVAAKEERR